MSATETTVSMKPLHLPSLAIKRFRGINELSISRLGHVTLLAGKNGVGKTTVLEAVQLYAARGRYGVLREILQNREELTETFDEDGRERFAPNWDALFHGRGISSDASISIGWGSESAHHLSIENAEFGEREFERFGRFLPEYSSEEDLRLFRIGFQGAELSVPLFLTDRTVTGLRSRRLFLNEAEFPPVTKCTSLGPGLPSNASMSKFWDSVALTYDEGRAVQALKLVFGDTVQRVAMIGDDTRASYGRRAVVKLKGQERPVPLRSLGDGAVRLFGVALALANSRDGFLVIDEAENGIHHSVQRAYWKMILKTAHENNVQVVATTHGWDCVVGFAQAAEELEEVDAALVRLEKDGGAVRAVEYSERNLKAAARSGIEVR